MEFGPEVIKQLRQADKVPYTPRPRDFIRRAPKRALLVIADGITPRALERANTPTLDALAAQGVSATDARTIFPTITGPAHTSLLTGARVGVHGFLYPKLLDAFGNRLLDFTEGLMRAETIAEAWRPNGILSVGIGSRFLRGADAQMNEGVLGEDFIDITNRSVQAVHDWQPHFLLVVYYVADTMGHLFGPEAPETLAAIEQIDAMTARLLDAYAENNLLDETVIGIVADHGMMQVQVTDSEFVQQLGAVAHGRVALAARAFDDAEQHALLNDGRVEAVWGQAELQMLGAWNARWGKTLVLLRDGLMFPHSRNLAGYHGAWSRTERHIPLILSGAGIRAGAALDTCEIIDIAPTLSVLLGGGIPADSQGRILWEVLDVESAPDVSTYVQLLLDRERVLGNWGDLKKDYATRFVSREQFETRRTELAQISELIMRRLEDEKEKLVDRVSR